MVDVPLDDNFGDTVNKLVVCRFLRLIFAYLLYCKTDDFWGPATRAIVITVNMVTPNYNDRATVLYLVFIIIIATLC